MNDNVKRARKAAKSLKEASKYLMDAAAKNEENHNRLAKVGEKLRDSLSELSTKNNEVKRKVEYMRGNVGRNAEMQVITDHILDGLFHGEDVSGLIKQAEKMHSSMQSNRQ